MMYFSRRKLLASVTALACVGERGQAIGIARPAAYGALPTPRQLVWHKRKTYAFVHFTINTFTDREWGYGDESAQLFDPTDFNADQIVLAAKTGGLTGMILTAKHHDGFCLWPSAYTEHSVKSSPYKNGRGDIVREMADAAHRHGLTFGLYLSPWDRNHAEYGRPAYVDYYHKQLEELTTQYGPLVEVWFDGANGGDGFYGGARERRKIDGKTYYQWEKVHAIVRRNQPNAVMFADAGTDIRWVGNEEGVAGDPCWPTVDTAPFTKQKGNQGVRGGEIWNPAETDVSIRPGWFWHSDETPRSPANLTRIYFESVGRGSNLLLNLAPDRRGRIPAEDIAALGAWRAIREKGFKVNLALRATVTASSTFGGTFAPRNILSDTKAWAASERDRAGAWVEFELKGPRTFNVLKVEEDVSFGVRVDDFVVESWHGGEWHVAARHTAIGPQRLVRFAKPITASRIRLRIVSAAASPILQGFGLYLFPEIIEEPAVSRDGQGRVYLRAADTGTEIRYTLDGTTPGARSGLYDQAIPLADGGLVKAVARNPETGATSAVASLDFDVSAARWRIVSATGDHPETLITGGSFLGRSGQSVEVILDLGTAYVLKGFALTPSQYKQLSVDTIAQIGPPSGYEAWVSPDGISWDEAGRGEFPNIAASRSEQKMRFGVPLRGRYLRLLFPTATQDKPVIVIGSLGIITR